jgi:hypothetical protein
MAKWLMALVLDGQQRVDAFLTRLFLLLVLVVRLWLGWLNR